MASGMEMMLKAIGLDPTMFVESANQIRALAQTASEKLTALELKTSLLVDLLTIVDARTETILHRVDRLEAAFRSFEARESKGKIVELRDDALIERFVKMDGFEPSPHVGGDGPYAGRS